MTRPTISLAVVAKNEELFLGECLVSARPFVDEMVVVVDTASTDRSMAIAGEAGARVIQEAWPGDLAAAHDQPARHAAGDWILSLDGDEVLDPATGARLAALAAGGAAEGFVFSVRNYSFRPQANIRAADDTDPLTHGARFWTPSRNVRLYRNDPAYRHEGRVHQTVAHAIRRAGGRVAEDGWPGPALSEPVIHHYGFLRADRRKSTLYEELTRQQVTDAPDDWKAHVELGTVHLGDGRAEEARRAFACAHALSPGPETAGFLAQSLLDLDRAAEARALLAELPAAPDAAMMFLSPADLLLLRAKACRRLGLLTEALADAGAAAAANPALVPARLLVADLLAAAERYEEATAAATRLTADYPGLAGGWQRLGTLNLHLDRTAEAAAALSVAVDIEPERVAAGYWLSVAQDQLGRPITARRTCRHAVAEDRTGWLDPALHAAFADLPGVAGAAAARPLTDGGVLHVIAHLSGGAAYVVTELARALSDTHEQAVVACSPGGLSGEAHAERLVAIDVPLYRARDAGEVAELQRRLAPSVVVHHWWPTPVLDRLHRQGRERLVLRGATPLPMPDGYDRYVTLSSFQAAYQSHLPTKRVSHIPNGVDLAAIDRAAPDHDIWLSAGLGQPNRVRIVLASRLDPDKFYRRLAYLLKPLSATSAAVLIAGRGARRWEIEGDLVRLGLSDRVRFLGPLPQDRVPGFLKSGHIALHLTETHQESHSLVVLQMLAAGLPVVAQPRGCLPALVADGETGFLTAGEAALSEALVRLVGDGALRARMGAAARTSAIQFGIDRFADAWRRLIATEIACVR